MERRTGWLIGRWNGSSNKGEVYLAPIEDSEHRSGWIPLVPDRLMKLLVSSVPPGGGGEWVYWNAAEMTGFETATHEFEVSWLRVDCEDGNFVEINAAANKVINNPYSN